jgi:acetyltransferase-like isoleucine patch superfamily enzyme
MCVVHTFYCFCSNAKANNRYPLTVDVVSLIALHAPQTRYFMDTIRNHIGNNVTFGRNFKIGQFCIIQDDVVIGDDVELESFCIIERGARIGTGCFVGTYSKVGSNANLGERVRMTAYCEIRSNCEVGDGSTFGSRCTLSAGTIVGKNVVVKYGFVATDTPDLTAKGKKTCILKDGSRYGANVVIMPGIVVGVNSEIGASSQVRHDVGDNEIWYGNPAKFYRSTN